MGNSYFRFKQFTIHQDKAAMKVGTDGILLGAWVDVADNPTRILDIGTGTGLIAIMLAQRTEALVDAVEIDESAYGQAVENMARSPWHERLSVWHGPVQEFNPDDTYDLIVSNPPFYQHAYAMGSGNRSLARHGSTLTYEALINAACRLLKDNGVLSIILPSQFGDEFVQLARTYNLFLRRICRVHPKPGTDEIRQLLSFARYASETHEDDLVIETNARHLYTETFRLLTQDFYLNH